ncbi:MAG: NUDIX domain-containing protein [Clostridia bacterium]|nr:NUDIX domain-containing protein [Clostridia bacterium]
MEKIRQNVMAIIIHENKLLLVKQRRANYWNFPKGGVKTGETQEIALEREILEETGLKNLKVLKKSKYSLYYDLPKDLQQETGFKGKHCSIFILVSDNGNVVIEDELSDYKWVKQEDFGKLLNYENLKQLADDLVQEIKEFGIIID